MELNRRTFLKTAFGAAAALSLPSWLMPQSYARAASNIREFRLSASRTKVNLGSGPDFRAWTYNGQVPGPEIRVKEGEIIRVFLKNDLPEETSIHWHGVPVPNPMDGVPGVTQKGVMPGETFVYEFEARPAGSYFYHSHAGYQLDQGLYGALIIEPAGERGSHDREYTLQLEDWVMRDGGGTADTRRRAAMGMMRGMMGRGRASGQAEGPLLEPIYDGYAVNGRLYPHIDPLVVAKGERVKLRLLNPSSSTIYDLRLAGHSLIVTHVDANPIKPMVTDILRIGMGERYDVEFVADNPGTWLLAAREQGYGEGRLRIPITYKGIQTKEPTPPLFSGNLRFAYYWDFKSLYPHQETSSNRVDRAFSQTLSGGMHSPYWTINGQVYPRAEALSVREGERVRIGYSNRSMMPHPMHLHGHFFKLVNPRLPERDWISKDTIIVNPMQNMEIEFMADNRGKWFHHCHNLYHMVAGMANVVNYET
ncbi:MAG: multicopper oxidase family protein [Desulfobacterales bacterium]|nr:multicopper oxidase family protein [Desulfobacterales bacterium]